GGQLPGVAPRPDRPAGDDGGRRAGLGRPELARGGGAAEARPLGPRRGEGAGPQPRRPVAARPAALLVPGHRPRRGRLVAVPRRRRPPGPEGEGRRLRRRPRPPLRLSRPGLRSEDSAPPGALLLLTSGECRTA